VLTVISKADMPVAARKKDPIWLAAPGLLYLLCFLIVPAGALLWLSFNDKAGNLTLDGYREMFTAGVYVKVLLNTFSIAAQTTIACLLFGYPVAYWLVHMPEKRRRWVILLVLLPFWMSALLKSFAWMVLLSRRGVLAQLASLFGFKGSIDVLYGHAAVVFAMAHTMLPLAILTIMPTLTNIDGQLSRAANTLGANAGQAFWRVYFPQSMPGIAAAGLLVFISSLGFFITPALLGSPHETVIGQLLITQVQQLLNWQLAGCLAMLLLVVTLAVCVIYDRVFGISAISGAETSHNPKSGMRRAGHGMLAVLAATTDMLDRAIKACFGRRRMGWLLNVFGIFVVAMLLLPVLFFPPMAFSSARFLQFPPPGFSLQWMQEYFTSDIWTGATIRSFGIALATAAFATALGGLAAFGVARTASRMSSAAFLVFLLPMIVPNIVTAVALFYVFAHLGLIATNLGIALGHTVIAMPLVFIIILTAFKNYDWRLDQAAATLGAKRPQVVRLITIPTVAGSVIAAFLFAFLSSFEELTISLFVGGGVKQTLPKQMWDDVLLQVSPTLAAASVVVLSVVVFIFLIAEWTRRAD
jgi:putative spermidine/putrescine transport system permease protein